MTRPIFSDAPRPLVLAHRGASAEHPENTLAAFEAAAAARADLVELDVRLTADGVPVVLHDADLARTTDRGGLVHELTLAEVRRADASGGRGARQQVPTLEESLELLDGTGTGMDVEIKSVPNERGSEDDTPVRAVLEVIEKSAFDGHVLLTSFNLSAIDRARRLAPRHPTGILTIGAISPRRALERARETGHRVILPAAPALLDAGPDLVAEAHAVGVAVGTWTVDDEGMLEELFSWDVDAIVTNVPGLGVAVRDRVARSV